MTAYGYGNFQHPQQFPHGPYHPAGLTGYYPPPNAAPFAPVYYAPQPQHQGQDLNQSAPTESKKRALEGADQFFDEVKRHKIQPVYDSNMAQRLSALQQYMPVSQENIDYQTHGGTPVSSAGQGAGSHPYTLPSLKTRQELVDANNFLTELSHNLYDSSAPAAAANNSSANYAQSGQFFFNVSPLRGADNLDTVSTQADQNGTTVTSGAPVVSMGATSGAGSAVLTPPNSTYNSSQSPVATNNGQQQTPPNSSPSSSRVSYPTVPAVSSGQDASANYASSVTSAPPALGTAFDTDQRRTFSVGVLQKAPRSVDEMDLSTDEVMVPKTISNSLIDPALDAGASPTATATKDEHWYRDYQIVESLRNIVSGMLRKAESEDEIVDEEMSDARQEITDDGAETSLPNEESKENSEGDGAVNYPVLRAVAAC